MPSIASMPPATNSGLFTSAEKGSFECACRLVLVQAELEVHTTYSKVGASRGKNKVERTGAWAPTNFVAQGDIDHVFASLSTSGRLEESENGLWIAKHVSRPDEATHGAAHGEHRGFRRERRGRAPC